MCLWNGVKRWASELSDAGVVFPQFTNFMDQYMEKTSHRGRLYDNNAKTGKFIWQKDTLIDLTFPQVLDRVVENFRSICFPYTMLDYTRTYSEFRDYVDNFARAINRPLV
jgi:fatty-acyl-CoA synthase